MAQVVPFVGAAVGFMIGGPAGAQAGWVLGSIAGSILAPTQTQEGSRLSDLKIQTSTYGKPIPAVFGGWRLAGNVIWAKEMREQRTTERVGKNQKVSNYSYYGTCAVAICEGPITGVRRIWADGKLAYDTSGGADSISDDDTRLDQYITIYRGTEEQMPDPTMQAALGANRCPAHRGTAYVVLNDLPLEKFGNRIPNFEFEVIAQSTTTTDVKDVVWHNPQPVGGQKVIGQAYDPVRGMLWIQAESSWPTIDFKVFNVQSKVTANVKLDGRALFRFGIQKLLPDLRDDDPVFRPSGTIRYDAHRDCLWVHGRLNGGGYGGDDAFARVNPDTGAILSIVQPTVRTNGGTNFCVLPDKNTLWYYTQEMPPSAEGSGFSGLPGQVTGIGDASNQRRFRVLCVSLSNGATSVIADRLEDGTQSTYGINGNSSSVEYDEKNQTVWVAYWRAGGSVVGTQYAIQGFDANNFWIDLQNINGNAPDYMLRATKPKSLPSYGQSWFVVEPRTRALWFYDGTSLNRIDPFTGKPVLVYTGPALGASASGDGTVYLMVTSGAGALTSQKAIAFDQFGAPLEKALEDSGIFNLGFDVFVDSGRSLVVSNYGMLYKDRLTASGVSVADIFTAISNRLRVPAEDYDVSAVSGPDYAVQGFAITTRTSGRSAFEPLMTAYALDVAESGGVARVLPRTHAPLAARIPIGDLAATDASGSDEPAPPVQSVLAQDQELPYQVEIGFANPEIEYRQDLRRYVKSTHTSSVDVRTLDLPIVMPAARAETLAQVLTLEAHMGRNTHELQVGIKYMHVEPGDVIDVETDNGWVRMYVVKTGFSPSGLLRISTRNFDYSLYEELSSTPNFFEVVSAPIPRVSAPALVLMDIPLLTSADDGPGFYAVAHTLTADAGFSKPSLLVSADDTNYSFVTAFATPGTVGRVVGALPAAATPELWDLANEITVHVVSGAFYSATDAQVLNGANLALLGGELIQFANAEANEDGSYTLSRLLRGRKGTEAAMAQHKSGDTLVLLDSNVARVELPVEMHGISRYYKLVSPGQDPVLVRAVQFACQDVGQECLAPVKLAGSRSEAGDLALSWVRRTRIGGELRDKTDALLGEATEAYEVDVVDGTGAVKRTFSASSPSLVYTASQQAEDFGSAQISVQVNVYQISASVGRGYPLIGTV
jgi:hypothetical protein